MSGDIPELDVARAHRHFAVECFNRAWGYIDRGSRTPGDDEAMVSCALASLWHWTQRTDCTAKNLSIGHWQVSRVYALTGLGEEAMRHGRRALDHATELGAFYRGYGHEAMARAARMLGDQKGMSEHLEQAKRCCASIVDAEEREALRKDLDELAKNG